MQSIYEGLLYRTSYLIAKTNKFKWRQQEECEICLTIQPIQFFLSLWDVSNKSVRGVNLGYTIKQ